MNEDEEAAMQTGVEVIQLLTAKGFVSRSHIDTSKDVGDVFLTDAGLALKKQLHHLFDMNPGSPAPDPFKIISIVGAILHMR